MWFPVLLLISAATYGIVRYERGRQGFAPSTAKPYVDPPTHGVYSVIVLSPDGYMQARRDFPEGVSAAKSWIASHANGATVAANSTYTLYDPSGAVAGTGSWI